MLRETAKQLVARVARTPIGKQFVHAAVLQDPSELRFSRVERWPDEIRGFEDLAFLFSSNQLNHGIASLRLDEAALLYRVARDAGPATLAEIGRFKGGSTLITAAAMHDEADLWSYDLHIDLSPDLPGEQLDRELQAALERLGLKKHVYLVVGDSRTALPPDDPLGSLFIDGDHSYEGARADYLHWRDHVAPGGHMLFHDAVDPGGYGNHYPGTERVVQEVTSSDRDFVRQPDAGSIAHFVRRS